MIPAGKDVRDQRPGLLGFPRLLKPENLTGEGVSPGMQADRFPEDAASGEMVRRVRFNPFSQVAGARAVDFFQGVGKGSACLQKFQEAADCPLMLHRSHQEIEVRGRGGESRVGEDRSCRGAQEVLYVFRCQGHRQDGALKETGP